MQSDTPVSLLMYGTIGIVLILAIFMLLRFLRKPQNRHPMDGQPERSVDQIRREGPRPPPH